MIKIKLLENGDRWEAQKSLQEPRKRTRRIVKAYCRTIKKISDDCLNFQKLS